MAYRGTSSSDCAPLGVCSVSIDESGREHPIVLYDGVCNYCNALCNFAIRRDPHKRLRFAHLQSELGQHLLRKYRLPEDLDSVVVVVDGAAYIKSDATIRMSPYLTGVARAGSLLRFVPRAIRDAVYDYIARHRYAWWGKQEQCIVPTKDVRDRFLT